MAETPAARVAVADPLVGGGALALRYFWVNLLEVVRSTSGLRALGPTDQWLKVGVSHPLCWAHRLWLGSARILSQSTYFSGKDTERAWNTPVVA